MADMTQKEQKKTNPILGTVKGVAGRLAAGATGVADSLTFGAANLIPGYSEGKKILKEKYPGSFYGGVVAGAIPKATTKLGLKALKAAGAPVTKKGIKQTVAKVDKYAPTEILNRLGSKAGAKVGTKIQAGKLGQLGKVGETATNLGVQGGVASGVDSVSESIDAGKSPMQIVSKGVKDTAVGIGTGAVLGGAGSLAKKAVTAPVPKTGFNNEAIISRGKQAINKPWAYAKKRTLRYAKDLEQDATFGIKGSSPADRNILMDHFGNPTSQKELSKYVTPDDVQTIYKSRLSDVDTKLMKEGGVYDKMVEDVNTVQDLWDISKGNPGVKEDILSTYVFKRYGTLAKNKEKLYENVYNEFKETGKLIGEAEKDLQKIYKAGIDSGQVKPVDYNELKESLDEVYNLSDPLNKAKAIHSKAGKEHRKLNESLNQLFDRRPRIVLNPDKLRANVEFFKSAFKKNNIDLVLDPASGEYVILQDPSTIKKSFNPILSALGATVKMQSLNKKVTPLDVMKMIKEFKKNNNVFTQVGKTLDETTYEGRTYFKRISENLESAADDIATLSNNSNLANYKDLKSKNSMANRIISVIGSAGDPNLLSAFQYAQFTPVPKAIAGYNTFLHNLAKFSSGMLMKERFRKGQQIGSKSSTIIKELARDKEIQPNLIKDLKRYGGYRSDMIQSGYEKTKKGYEKIKPYLQTGQGNLKNLTTQHIRLMVPDSELGGEPVDDGLSIFEEEIKKKKEGLDRQTSAGVDVESFLSRKRMKAVVNKNIPKKYLIKKKSKNDVIKMSEKDKLIFEKNMSIAFLPDVMLEKLETGGFSSQNVKDFKMVNPYLYNSLKLKLYNDYKQNEESYSYAKKLRLAKFLNIDLTGLTGGMFNVNEESAEPIQARNEKINNKTEYVKGTIRKRDTLESSSPSYRYASL